MYTDGIKRLWGSLVGWGWCDEFKVWPLLRFLAGSVWQECHGAALWASAPNLWHCSGEQFQLLTEGYIKNETFRELSVPRMQPGCFHQATERSWGSADAWEMLCVVPGEAMGCYDCKRKGHQPTFTNGFWCEFCGDVRLCIHKSKGSIPCGGQCIPQRCSRPLPDWKQRVTTSDVNPHLPHPKRHLRLLWWPWDGAWMCPGPCWGIRRGFEQLLRDVLWLLPQPAVSAAWQSWNIPSHHLSCSLPLWIALNPNIIEDYYNLPSQATINFIIKHKFFGSPAPSCRETARCSSSARSNVSRELMKIFM